MLSDPVITRTVCYFMSLNYLVAFPNRGLSSLTVNSSKNNIGVFYSLGHECLSQEFHHASLLQTVSKLVCAPCSYELVTVNTFLWCCGIGTHLPEQNSCGVDIWLRDKTTKLSAHVTVPSRTEWQREKVTCAEKDLHIKLLSEREILVSV